MIRVYVTRQSRYPADTKSLKLRVVKTLREKNVQDGVVSIILVGERKIRALAKRYLGEDSRYPLHEVLSFPASDQNTKYSSLELGDIFVCYPEARDIAMKRNRMVDDVLGELVEHSTLHLLGIHHD